VRFFVRGLGCDEGKAKNKTGEEVRRQIGRARTKKNF